MSDLFFDLAAVLYAVAAAGAVLVTVVFVRFTRRERREHPVLERLHQQKWAVIVGTLAAVFGGLCFTILSGLVKQPSLEPHSGPGTLQALVATTSGFEREVNGEGARRVGLAFEHFKAATTSFTKHEYLQAIPEYRLSIDAIPTRAAYLNLGIALRFTASPDEAVKELTAGRDLSRRDEDPDFHANFLLQLAAVDSQLLGRRAEAEPLAEKAVEEFRQAKNRVGEADALLSLASIYRITGKPRTATAPLVDGAAKLYQESHSVLGLANIEIYRGVEQVGALHCADAVSHFKAALALFEKIDHVTGQVRARISISSCMPMLGRPEEGVNELRQAVQVAKGAHDLNLQGTALIALAQVLDRENRFDDSVKVAKEALALGRAIPSLPVQQYASLVLADVALNRRDSKTSLAFAESALNIAIQTNEANGKISALCIKGRIFLQNSEPRLAVPLLEEAVGEVHKSSPPVTDINCLAALADALSAVGRKQDAAAIRTEIDTLQRPGR